MTNRKNSTPLQETKTTYYSIKDRFSKEHLNQFSEETSLAMKAVLEAAYTIKTVDISSNIESKDGIQNFVTKRDEASEEVILKLIKHGYPADPILSEESFPHLNNPLSNERLWVIDPLDGTNNALRDRGYDSISIGFLKNGKPFSGAVYNPTRDELFYAQQGIGSFLKAKKIHVAQEINIENASVNTDRSYDTNITQKHLEMFIKLHTMPQLKGSAVLTMADLAAGRYDLFFHTDIKPWDNAAAFALIENAGGIIRGIDGRKIDIMSKDIVVGNEKLVQQFIERMRS